MIPSLIAIMPGERTGVFACFYLVNFSCTARLTEPLEQEQDHVWTLVPLRQQTAVHHRHSACDRSCFQAARARTVLLEGVLHQQKAGARRPLGARLPVPRTRAIAARVLTSMNRKQMCCVRARARKNSASFIDLFFCLCAS